LTDKGSLIWIFPDKPAKRVFASYVGALVEVIGHADRAAPGERKSVEPMAAIVARARVSAKHQSLLHLVGQAPWPDEAVLQ
jgi:SRSO17 transposase